MQMKLRMLRNFLKTTKLGKADQDKSLVCLTKILSSSWEPGSQDNHWKQVLQQTCTAAVSSFALGWLAQAFPLLLRELASTAIKLVLGTGLWQNKLLSIRTYLWSYAFFPRGNQQPWRMNSGVPIFTPCLQMGLPRGVTIPRAPCAVRRRLYSSELTSLPGFFLHPAWRSLTDFPWGHALIKQLPKQLHLRKCSRELSLRQELALSLHYLGLYPGSKTY